jgi:hypothetical protein
MVAELAEQTKLLLHKSFNKVLSTTNTTTRRCQSQTVEVETTVETTTTKISACLFFWRARVRAETTPSGLVDNGDYDDLHSPQRR